MLKICEYCGEEFKTNHSNQRFCCKSCAGQSRFKEDIGLFRADVDDYIQKYLLGLIITDGCVYAAKSHMYICISLKDKYMIQKIRDIVCPTKKVYKDGNNSQVKWRNDRDIKYLYSLGIGVRKTYTVELPMFNDNMWHLMRGIFDGDGCVYKSRIIDKKYNREYIYTYISFTTGSSTFAEQLNNFLLENDIKSHMHVDKRKEKRKNTTYYIVIQKRDCVFRFRDLIYKNCNDWFLKRKYKVFLE